MCVSVYVLECVCEYVCMIMRVCVHVFRVFCTHYLLCRCSRVYNIGVEVKQGHGRYRQTNIITFAPRFEIDNQSSHKLAIAQRHLAKGQVRCHQISVI
jgi:hypothetical protein